MKVKSLSYRESQFMIHSTVFIQTSNYFRNEANEPLFWMGYWIIHFTNSLKNTDFQQQNTIVLLEHVQWFQ